MGQIIELLKSMNYQVSKELLFNYKTINITERQLIILIYLINQTSNTYNPKQISNDFNISMDNMNAYKQQGFIARLPYWLKAIFIKYWF